MGADLPRQEPMSNHQTHETMKLYIVYFRTMVDSPEVTIECVTASRSVAVRALLQARREETEWMADEDEDSGNWAEACIRSFGMPDSVKEGDTIHILVHTWWYDEVVTSLYPLIRREDAETLLRIVKEDDLRDFPTLAPSDEDETIEESMHMESPSVAVDTYYEIVDANIQ